MIRYYVVLSSTEELVANVSSGKQAKVAAHAAFMHLRQRVKVYRVVLDPKTLREISRRQVMGSCAR